MRGDRTVSAYVAALVAATGIYAILSAIAPKNEETRRAVYLVLSFSLLALLISPMVSGALDGEPDSLFDITLPEYGHDEGYFTEEARAAVTDGITKAVSERFALPEGTLSTECEFGDGVRLTAVRFYLSGRGIFADNRGIEDYAKENFCSNCEVILIVK